MDTVELKQKESVSIGDLDGAYKIIVSVGFRITAGRGGAKFALGHDFVIVCFPYFLYFLSDEAIEVPFQDYGQENKRLNFILSKVIRRMGGPTRRGMKGKKTKY